MFTSSTGVATESHRFPFCFALIGIPRVHRYPLDTCNIVNRMGKRSTYSSLLMLKDESRPEWPALDCTSLLTHQLATTRGKTLHDWLYDITITQAKYRDVDL